jgi:hypothetical protein
MSEHVSFLVTDAALHGDLAEHGADRLSESLCSVDHQQHPLLRIKSTLHQIGEQSGRDGRVLAGALPQAERDLHPLRCDPQGNDVRAAFQIQAIDHHHSDPHVIQPPAHEL